MYFTIKYIEYKSYIDIENNKKSEENVEKSKKDLSLKEMLDNSNKLLLVNPDCPIGIIRDYITNIVGLKDVEFDLTTEKAKILQTIDASPSICGLEFFRIKEIYYIVLRKSMEQEISTLSSKTSEYQYVPLLIPISKEYTDFCAYYKRRSTVGGRRSTGSYRDSKDSDTIKSSASGKRSISKSATK